MARPWSSHYDLPYCENDFSIRRIFTKQPCLQRAKKQFNLVLLHPDDGSVESWEAQGSADRMREDFAGWDPK